MQRSKYIFVILAIIYSVIGICYFFDGLIISDNLLLALSVTALLISVSDVFSKIAEYCIQCNAYCASLKITIDFLDTKTSVGNNNTIIDFVNVKKSLIDLQRKKYKFISPDEYERTKLIKGLRYISIVLFVLGMASFIAIPFMKDSIASTKISSIITIFAFSSMALSMFFDELLISKQADQERLLNDKHSIIFCSFSDFHSYFQTQLFHNHTNAHDGK